MMDVYMIERLLQESTREYVYRFLKVNIMNLKFLPGTAISEKEIAVLLNVSRTPVREAFIQLSQEYLLDILPQKGTYISLIEVENVEEARFLRETLEKAIVSLACTDFPQEKLFELQSYVTLQELYLQENNYVKFYELDESLHSVIFAGCRKARTWSVIQQMNTHYNRVRLLNVTCGHDLMLLLQQHQDLVRAIREKDVILGNRTIELHLNKVKIDIKDLMSDYSHYFKQPIKI
jgi:DNA-binding GntR family transcriptional regulator